VPSPAPLHNVFAMIYTDADLKNIDGVFNDIAKYLKHKTMEKAA